MLLRSPTSSCVTRVPDPLLRELIEACFQPRLALLQLRFASREGGFALRERVEVGLECALAGVEVGGWCRF